MCVCTGTFDDRERCLISSSILFHFVPWDRVPQWTWWSLGFCWAGQPASPFSSLHSKCSYPLEPPLQPSSYFIFAYRMNTSSIVVTEAPKVEIPSSICLCSNSVNRASNLEGKKVLFLKDGIPPWAFYSREDMGFIVDISVQISALSLSFTTITFELVIVFTLGSSCGAKSKIYLVQKWSFGISEPRPNEE